MIVNCLFDSGSQRSFVKKSVAEALSLRGPYETVSIESFGNISSECIRVRRVKFWLTSVRDNSPKKQMVEALCLKKITDRPNVRLNIKQYSHFKSLQLAEDFTDLSSTFDVLIGLDYYYDFINQVIMKGQKGEPMAIHSTLGWIICGPIPEKVETKSVKTFTKVVYKDEEKGADSKASQLFEKTVRFDGKRYEVQLPWSNEEVQLPNNYNQALSRLLQTERSLRRNPTKALLYSDGMTTWKNVVSATSYSPTRRQIQQLEAGPPLQNDLVQILIRFRRFRVGLQADIKDVLADCPTRKGLRCHSIYMERDGVSGCTINIPLQKIFPVDELVDAKETVIQLVALMKKGGFHLTKWISNMDAVLAKLPSDDLMKKDTNLVSKPLGIVWDSANDELAYGVPNDVDLSSSDTKR
ncbi:hypothetical protein T10_11196 [Trichinella papuae]|uniref:DUF1758 domain-containing protein n=1 Tax=Trichinella papuae TaxID=268474 RepID=A0A0V1MQN8_9BILA|nr:hypothetical protein T10_11196 [Trichinella papuae]